MTSPSPAISQFPAITYGSIVPVYLNTEKIPPGFTRVDPSEWAVVACDRG